MGQREGLLPSAYPRACLPLLLSWVLPLLCLFVTCTHTHTHIHTSGLESQPGGGREATGLSWVLIGSLILKNLQRNVSVRV